MESRAIQEAALMNARLLVVDDDPADARLLGELLLRRGYLNLRTVTDPRQTRRQFLDYRPDLLVLDLVMPEMNGFQVMDQLRALLPESGYLPILVLTGSNDPDLRRRALAAGANDFMLKPFDTSEVLLRIRNLLEVWFFRQQMESQNRLLEDRIRERTWELEDTQIEILERLARAAEYRDYDTGEHTARVGKNAELVAGALGLPARLVETIRRTAPLHDVGKIAIPDAILLKPGRLNHLDIQIMRHHTTTGASLLSGSRSDLLRTAELVALSHHERWDGMGYPRALHGEQIPLVGRIVAVADVFDALIHDRPYKVAWPLDAAIEEIRRQSGSQFDPRVVEAFLTIPHEILERDTLRSADPDLVQHHFPPATDQWTSDLAENRAVPAADKPARTRE